MSEMSREEAIQELNDLAMYVEHAFTEAHKKTAISAIAKAISDMEKLQKIEALYGIDKFGKVLTREERDMEVQKILEGE